MLSLDHLNHALKNNLCQYYRLEQKIDHFRACLKTDKCPFVFEFSMYENFDRVTKKTGVMPWPNKNFFLKTGMQSWPLALMTTAKRSSP